MAQSGSFIPKQQAPRMQPTRRRRVYVISYVVYTIFLGVIVTAVGLFFWEIQLNSVLSEQQAQLQAEREAFKTEDILRVQRREAELETVAYLLDNQPALTNVLAALEDSVVDPVYLEGFAISSSDTEASSEASSMLEISYTGYTDSFGSVLAAREAVSVHPLLQDAIITDISYGNTGDSEDTTSVSRQYPISYGVTLILPVSDVVFSGDANAVPVNEQTSVIDDAVDIATTTIATTSPNQ